MPSVFIVLGGDAMANMTLSGNFNTAELPRLAADPVTVTVSRSVAPGKEIEFENWAETITTRLSAFPGSLGAGLLRPGPDGGDYQMVFRFKDALSLRLWERSPQRAALLDEIDPIVTETRIQRTVGVEQWFDLPDRAEPTRKFWHRVFTDVAWVYPIAIVVSLFVAPFLARMPIEVRTLLSSALITVVMRAGIGPLRKRLRSRRSFG
jgi:uncharacterized protein